MLCLCCTQHGHQVSIPSSKHSITARLPLEPGLLLSCSGHHPAPQAGPSDPQLLPRDLMLLRDPRAMGKGLAERDMPSSGCWAGPLTSGSEAGPAPGLAAGSAPRAGHGALHLPLAAEKEAEKVWFSLIFFFKSFLAPLPFIVFCQYFFEGAGE